ncbi:phage tail tape measure protein [Neobacillus mesonae]|uniref:phage tail tape measure protein n=1 Tax=Neobacillus mesonae TaxID=1193713 RepID=UPI0020419AAE|nr:phage tail tape measure protein [Neobacillus mesonae]MCM3567848.1 phage tail tape measure protein [Neobacillus mesonae]
MSNARVFEIAFQLGASMNSSVRSAFANTNQMLSNTSDNTDKLNSRSKILEGGLKAIKATAAATAGAFAALGTGMVVAVKHTDEFNSAMKHIAASTGTSLKDMKEIKEISKNLYNENLGEDWNDLAEAISTAKSVTGLSGKELQKATENALVYRDVWGEEVSQSIKATDTMMKNFGITSTQAFNLMAQGAQKGLNKSDELIDSANEYSPYFKTLGFSANQMFDIFSTGLKNGAFNLIIRALQW